MGGSPDAAPSPAFVAGPHSGGDVLAALRFRYSISRGFCPRPHSGDSEWPTGPALSGQYDLPGVPPPASFRLLTLNRPTA